MSNLANPLQAIINQASKLPNSQELSRYNERINYGGFTTVVLLDVSGSMNKPVESGERKIDVLRAAFDRPVYPNEIILVFNDQCRRIESFENLNYPIGSTNLYAAIEAAKTWQPKRTLIVSDGQPDDPNAAIGAAETLTGVISTLYIGLDSDREAIAFMKELAQIGCGRSQVCNIVIKEQRVQLKSVIAGLLPY